MSFPLYIQQIASFLNGSLQDDPCDRFSLHSKELHFVRFIWNIALVNYISVLEDQDIVFGSFSSRYLQAALDIVRQVAGHNNMIYQPRMLMANDLPIPFSKVFKGCDKNATVTIKTNAEDNTSFLQNVQGAPKNPAKVFSTKIFEEVFESPESARQENYHRSGSFNESSLLRESLADNCLSTDLATFEESKKAVNLQLTHLCSIRIASQYCSKSNMDIKSGDTEAEVKPRDGLSSDSEMASTVEVNRTTPALKKSGSNEWCNAFDAVCCAICCWPSQCGWELHNSSELTPVPDNDTGYLKGADVMEINAALGLKWVVNGPIPFSKVMNECERRLVQTYQNNPNPRESVLQKNEVRTDARKIALMREKLRNTI